MNRLGILSAACFCILVSLKAGTNLGAPAEATNDGEPPEVHRLYYADLVRAAASFDEVVVWEGLPHPMWERELYEHEQRFAQHMEIGDQLFYVAPLKVSDFDRSAISEAILGHRDNFKPWSGFKFCGGFHADYAVEWRFHHDVVAQALICFGCEEVQFRSGYRWEWADQSPEGRKRLFSLLHPYRHLRPVAQASPVPKVDTPSIPKPNVPVSKIVPPPLPAPSLDGHPMSGEH